MEENVSNQDEQKQQVPPSIVDIVDKMIDKGLVPREYREEAAIELEKMLREISRKFIQDMALMAVTSAVALIRARSATTK